MNSRNTDTEDRKRGGSNEKCLFHHIYLFIFFRKNITEIRTQKLFNDENVTVCTKERFNHFTSSRSFTKLICLDIGGGNQSINIDQTSATSSFK